MASAMRKGIVKRGFRIRILVPGRPSVDRPLIWSSDIPHEWSELHQDASVSRAVLYRSGRKVAEYTRAASEEGAA